MKLSSRSILFTAAAAIRLILAGQEALAADASTKSTTNSPVRSDALKIPSILKRSSAGDFDGLPPKVDWSKGASNIMKAARYDVGVSFSATLFVKDWQTYKIRPVTGREVYVGDLVNVKNDELKQAAEAGDVRAQVWLANGCTTESG